MRKNPLTNKTTDQLIYDAAEITGGVYFDQLPDGKLIDVHPILQELSRRRSRGNFSAQDIHLLIKSQAETIKLLSGE